jgi:cell division FtsZ-interacting protein ZapD
LRSGWSAQGCEQQLKQTKAKQADSAQQGQGARHGRLQCPSVLQDLFSLWAWRASVLSIASGCCRSGALGVNGASEHAAMQNRGAVLAWLGTLSPCRQGGLILLRLLCVYININTAEHQHGRVGDRLRAAGWLMVSLGRCAHLQLHPSASAALSRHAVRHNRSCPG